MLRTPRLGLSLAVLISSSLGAVLAQAPASRISGDWRSSATVAVASAGPRAPQAKPTLGSAPGEMRLERMILLLDASAAQQRALTAELAHQQDPSSPEFHHWMTPGAFAAAYANSAEDTGAVTAWLRSEGFDVSPLPAGRGWIEFSGTALLVERAFHTQVDLASTATGTRAILAGGISVPAAFSGVVHGLVSLDGALSATEVTQPQPMKSSAAELAAENSRASAEAMTPRLAGQLLHFDALHASGVRGEGGTIAIPTRSNVSAADVAAFRAAFGLPASPLRVVLNGADPGRNSDEPGAVFAASWAGAAAPAARVVVMTAGTTEATDGVDLALAAIVDQAMAHTVAVGSSTCEAAVSEAHLAFYAALYRQAAAEGIAVVAAAGDGGAAACRVAGSEGPVGAGYGVNALASTQWNTAVGVAAFDASGAASSLAGWSQQSIAEPGYAGGGGRSAIYSEPAWQEPLGHSVEEAGARHRMLPDLALPAAIDGGVNRGLAYCLSGSGTTTGCRLVRSGGSSGAAAMFAGIGALLAGKYGPQGNLAPHLYAVSSRGGVFEDVHEGSARLRCAAGSVGCDADGTIGYTAGPGYDLATGLGMVDAQALVAGWAATPNTGRSLANVVNTTGASQTINPSGSVVLSARVTSGTGQGAPTGTVGFFDQTSSTDVATVSLVAGSGEVSTASVTITGVLTQGGHPIEADYSGDSIYAAARSQPVVVEVQPSSTTTVVTPATSTPTAGSALTVTAAITSLNAGTGALPPSGTVDFRLDGVSQGVKQVVPGTPSTSSIVMTVPDNAGAHQIVGFYGGDNDYTNSTSQAATITVAKNTTTLSLSPATTTPYAGSSLQVTATIGATFSGVSEPSGTVTFTLDGVAQGSALVTQGSPSTANFSITVPATGTHTLGASYSGDSNYTSSTATPVSIAVAKSPTTVTVTPATATPAPGSTLQISASITALFPGSTIPTGIVTFTLDGKTAGTGIVVSGTTATLAITAPATGTHTLQATYSGDTYYSDSTSTVVDITVAKSATTTVVTPASTTLAAGSSLQVTATVAPALTGTTQPTGTVAFSLDGTSLGASALTPGAPSTATTIIPAASLTPGAHVLAGTYSGDTYYTSSAAVAVAVTVTKSPTAIVVSPATVTPTAGGSLLVTASITSTNLGATLPSGTVNITLDGVSQGVATVVAGAPSTATVTIPVLSAGSHLLGGIYSGDTYYATSSSPAVALNVAKGGTATVVTASPAVLTVGISETLTATISPLNGLTGAVYTITGSVSFYDNGTKLLGTAPVTANAATLTGVTLANNINHTITAIYSGDTSWLASASSALLLQATTLPDTVLLTANLATVGPGQTVTLVATVTPNSIPAATSEQNPSGNVIFYNGTTVLGTVPLVATALNDSSTATLIVALPGGLDVLTASYAGDLYFDAGVSNALTIDDQDFTIVPDPSNPPTDLTIVKGQSGSASFDVKGLGGYNNQIAVVCAVPTQDDMGCTISPQVITPDAVVTFTVTTYLTGGPATTAATRRPQPLWPRAVGGSALAILGFLMLPFGRRVRVLRKMRAAGPARRFWFLLLLVALGSAGLGCSNSVVLSNPNQNGTPLGVATLKITAAPYVGTTTVSHSVYLTVNVIAPASK